jgi:hypothetical protein
MAIRAKSDYLLGKRQNHGRDGGYLLEKRRGFAGREVVGPGTGARAKHGEACGAGVAVATASRIERVQLETVIEG